MVVAQFISRLGQTRSLMAGASFHMDDATVRSRLYWVDRFSFSTFRVIGLDWCYLVIKVHDFSMVLEVRDSFICSNKLL